MRPMYGRVVARDLRYEPPPDLDRAAVERGLKSGKADEQIDALHAAVFNDEDAPWVLATCLHKLKSPQGDVRFAAAAFIATFIQMRRYATPDTRDALLAAKKQFPELGNNLGDALDGLTCLGV